MNELNARRAHTLARLAAYTLAFVALTNAVLVLFPLPWRDPPRVLAIAAELLDRSPLLVLALVLLYGGLAPPARPSFWECKLALLLRPLLRLLPVLYLVLLLVIGIAGHRVQARTVNGIRFQLDRSLQGIDLLGGAVAQQPDAAALASMVEAQPLLRNSLARGDWALDTAAPLQQQRLQVQERLDRTGASLRSAALRGIADAGGAVLRQQLRLGAAALAYALFFLLAGLIWPRSMAGAIDPARAPLEAADAP